MQLELSAQITAEYPREISCEIGFTAELPLPVVKSTCSAQIHTTQNEELASGGCRGTLIRKYTFVDDCENMLEAEQIIHLKDTEAPILYDVPAELFLTKKEAMPVASIVTATDNSGEEIVVEFSETKTDNTVTRTWIAMDGCNNRSSAVQKIHLSR